MIHNSKKLSIIFFGSSKYATIDEKALFDAFGLSLVVTLPDKEKANPVKQFALDNTIPVITTDSLTPEVGLKIAEYQPDFLVVADFRLIIPDALIQLPKKAAINVHHSLLPKFRGPAPVPFTILSGDSTTGVSIICIAKKVDAGDILAQELYEMTPTDTSDSVLKKLNELGGALAVEVIENFDEDFAKRQQQDEAKATFTHFMRRDDGYVDLANPPSVQQLDRMIRAYFPWPGVWLNWHMADGKSRIVKLLPNQQIQVEGKKPMNYKDFMNGYTEGKVLLEKLQLI